MNRPALQTSITTTIV